MRASGRFANDQQIVNNSIHSAAIRLNVREGHRVDIGSNLLDCLLHIGQK